MDWQTVQAPTIDEFEILARNALNGLPQRFRALCVGVNMRIEELPSDEICEELGLESPFELTGLYQGVDLLQKSEAEIAPLPDMIVLYRRPILDEWSEGGLSLGALVRHVLVHEIGHHFGFTDSDMDAIEALEAGQ